MATHQAHTDFVTDLAVETGKQCLLSVSGDGCLSVLDLRANKVSHQFCSVVWEDLRLKLFAACQNVTARIGQRIGQRTDSRMQEVTQCLEQRRCTACLAGVRADGVLRSAVTLSLYPKLLLVSDAATLACVEWEILIVIPSSNLQQDTHECLSSPHIITCKVTQGCL